MSVRERINRVRIEGFRLSRVPIDATETIFQGDQMVWNDSLHLATKQTGASGSQFIGISDTTNPIETIGSSVLLSNPSSARINVIQQGLVEQLVGTTDNGATYRPFDTVIYEGDAQSVKKSASNPIAFVDPGWSGTGKVVATGDIVRLWLAVPAAYRAFL